MPEGPTLSLPIDASGARRGAAEFAAAIQLIDAAGRRATSSIAGLEGSISAGSNALRQGQSAFQSYISQLNSVAAAQKNAASAARSYADSIAKSGSQVEGLGRSAAASASGFTVARGAAAGFIAGLATAAVTEAVQQLSELGAELVRVSGAYTNIDSRINLYTSSVKDISAVHEDLVGVAERTRTSFEATGGFFARLASQTKNLGLSYEDMVQLTETLQQGFRVSGASATETASAMQQLGQAFAKGRLNGDELIAVAENSPRIMDALGEAFGVSQGQIRDWAEDGVLSAEAVAAAMLMMKDKIAEQFAQMGKTVEDSTTNMKTAFNELLVKFDETAGITDRAIQALDGITAWMKSPAGEQAVNDFANAINSLIETFGSLIEQAGPVIGALSSIGKAYQDIIGMQFNAAKSLIQGKNPFGYDTGGGFGGEFDTPGNIAAVMGDKGFAGIAGVQLSPNAVKGEPEKPAVSKEESSKLREKFGLKVGGGAGAGKKKSRGGGKKTDPSIAGLERAREQLAKQQQEIELFGKERDQAIARAVDSLGKYATPQMKEQAAVQAGTLFDLNQMQKQKDALDSLSASVRTFGNERAKAEESAVKQLGEYATPEQVQQAKDYANQLIDIQAKEEATQKAADNRRAMMEQGRSVTESVQTAEESYMATVAQLDQLLSTVVVTQEDYDRSIADLSASLSAGVISQEEYNAQVAKLGELLGSTAISQETYNRAVAAAAPPTWGSELLKLGDSLNSFDNQFQTLESGIMSFTGLVSDAFTDAIFSGESFGVTLEKLGMSIAEMTTKLLIQLALQQAIGAGLQAAFTPGVAAGAGTTGTTAGGGGGGFFGMRTGGVAVSALPHGVYTEPTYFPMASPQITAFAKGGGLLGEAGPEAVLPLSRDSSGRLGVTTVSAMPGTVKQEREQEKISLADRLTSPKERAVFWQTPEIADQKTRDVSTSSVESKSDKERVYDKTSSDSIHNLFDRQSTSNILYKDSSSNTKEVFSDKSVFRDSVSVQERNNADSKESVSNTSTLKNSERVYDKTQIDRATPYRMGGRFVSSLKHTIYNSPTYFHMSEPGEHRMATGLGLLGEAGPEAVLPLTRTPSGTLGVRAVPSSSGQQPSVLPLKRTPSGVLGVEQRFANGGVINRNSSFYSLSDNLFATYNASTSNKALATYNNVSSSSSNVLDSRSNYLTAVHYAKGGVFNDTEDRRSYSSSRVSNYSRFSPKTSYFSSTVAGDPTYHSVSDNRAYQSTNSPTEMHFAKGGVVTSSNVRNDFKSFYGGKTTNQSTVAGDSNESVSNVYRDTVTNEGSRQFYSLSPITQLSKTFAYGGAIRATLPHGVYQRPTFFPVQTPGYFPMARGSGVVGEAGPEAVLPLVRGPGGSLGVQSDGGQRSGNTVNVTVNNNSKADVSTEHRENADGGTDVMITIADHVENVVATRMMRSGTKVNRAVPQVGRVVAR